MKIQTIYEDNFKRENGFNLTIEEATKLMPWAYKIVKISDSYLGFESQIHYEIWNNHLNDKNKYQY